VQSAARPITTKIFLGARSDGGQELRIDAQRLKLVGEKFSCLIYAMEEFGIDANFGRAAV
jgi:hypothetical protein